MNKKYKRNFKPAGRLSVDEFMEFGPCYDCSSLLNDYAGSDGRLGATEIMSIPGEKFELDSIMDRVWLLTRPGVMAEYDLHLIACEIVEQITLPIWSKYYPNDKRPDDAVSAKRRWLAGEISDEELAAYASAYASYASAAYAAYAYASAAAASADAAYASAAAASAKRNILEIFKKYINDAERIQK